MLIVEIRGPALERLALVEIVNDRTGNAAVASYDVAVAEGRMNLRGTGPAFRARVEGFERRRGAIALAAEALKALTDA